MHDDKRIFSFDKFSSETDTELYLTLEKTVSVMPVLDIHTHLYPPQFGSLNLWGIDEILNYHYLVAEFFRYSKITPDEFFRFEKSRRADLIWQTLFVENTPLSEATCGVITVLNALGLDTRSENLSQLREFFRASKAEEHLEKVFGLANVSGVVMTNDPLDAEEKIFWDEQTGFDPRFHAAFRLDRLLNGWSDSYGLMENLGYRVSPDLDDSTISGIRRFLDEWSDKINPLYMAASLADDFSFPENSSRGIILSKAVLPFCRERKIPLSLMIGVRRQINPAIGSAGDGVGRADVSALSRICAENPDVNFLATFLSRENQHELCVTARKFSNLMPFGCWWFLNNPSIISEITNERLELLGTSFIPQHSDARILDQLIYKWKHSRQIVTNSLFQSYKRLLKAGRDIASEEIENDVRKLFSKNFEDFVSLSN